MIKVEHWTSGEKSEKLLADLCLGGWFEEGMQWSDYIESFDEEIVLTLKQSENQFSSSELKKKAIGINTMKMVCQFFQTVIISGKLCDRGAICSSPYGRNTKIKIIRTFIFTVKRFTHQ